MSDVTTKLATEANDKAMEIARLKADNDRLREQIHWLKKGDILHVLTDQEYIDQCERERLMQVSIDALDKDNAKLRELVRIMAYCMQYERDCDGCRMNGADGAITHAAGCDGLLDRMHELEVDA